MHRICPDPDTSLDHFLHTGYDAYQFYRCDQQGKRMDHEDCRVASLGMVQHPPDPHFTPFSPPVSLDQFDGYHGSRNNAHPIHHSIFYYFQSSYRMRKCSADSIQYNHSRQQSSQSFQITSVCDVMPACFLSRSDYHVYQWNMRNCLCLWYIRLSYTYVHYRNEKGVVTTQPIRSAGCYCPF